jgi:glycosyltransferase involved in cell wall biosynthesis
LSSRNQKVNRRRLLIILNRFVIGGQAVDTLPVAYYLKGDFDILVVYGVKGKDEIEPFFLLEKYPGIRLKRISFLRRSLNPVIDLLALLRLIIITLSFKPDIVHTHGAKPGVVGRLAASLCRVPAIVHTFHGHFFHSYFSKTTSFLIGWIERLLARRTTAVIALSEAQKRDLVEVYKITAAHKVHIVPLGVDEIANNEAGISRKLFREKWSVPDDVVAIGIVGRIVPVKNHYFFLEIVERVLFENTDTKVAFFIIGDGALRPSLEKFLKQKNIHSSSDKYSETSKIVFTSWIADTAQIMSGLDILTLTSLNEGTPLTLIEAQYFKRPVVATNVGGVKDTIEDGKTGFLVEPEDIDAFAEKLQLLINDASLRETMGKAGRRLVAEKFSKQKEVAALKNLYLSLLQKKSSKSSL